MKENYLPLYRKYRPQKLEDLVGQSYIKKALTNAIQLDKIAHAYLFTGPRGTGKTSTARILAKSLNCVNGPTINPCGECESCISVTNSVPIDVIEIDAASNRSVEDAHNILEKIQYAPVQGKYKIYIIDEVHMLTQQAFNALLKTLEEPPKNVVFILATTESHKVLDTIKSRCQRFDFKRITTSDIVEHLEKIANLEKINITKEAITMIARLSAGGMRDSLALLDQVSALGGDSKITEDDVNNLLGRLSFETLTEMTTAILNSNPNDAINILDKIYNDGNEPIIILNNFLLYLKNLLIVNSCDTKNAVELTSLNDAQVKILADFKSKIEVHQIVSLINKVSDYIKEIRLSNYQQMWMEVAIIDLANLSQNTKLEDLERRLSALESGVQPVHTVPSVAPIVKQPIPAQPKAVVTNIESSTKENNVVESNKPKEIKPVTDIENSDIVNIWLNILSNITDVASQKWLEKQAKPAEITKDKITLVIQKSSWVDRFNNSEKRQIVIDAASLVLGNPKIQVIARTPLKDEITVSVPQKEPEKKKIIIPQNIEPEEDEKTQMEELDSAINTQENPKTNDNKSNNVGDMLVDLFDGKYLN